MVFSTIVLFFVYTFCLGFAATSFVKNSDNFIERNLMRIGFGLALVPFLGLLLNLLRIPIDWKIILSLSLVYPLYHLIKNKLQLKPRFAITKTDLSIFAMLVIFLVNLYVYASGAFNYPYFEDDDPWSHAMGVKYVSIEKTVFEKTSVGLHYIDPYPPTYDLFLGILLQTDNSVYWTLKFFNALIISLSTIFFYFFVKEFAQDKNKALFASFALASIPAFMSHFIWSIALTMPLYFVVFYALERIKYDKKWWIVASLAMVTALTSSPTHSTYFGLFFILYLFAKMILERSILIHYILSGVLGALLSFIFWWGPMILKYGFYQTLKSLGIGVGTGRALSIGGTGDRIYSFSDFFVAQNQNMINNPIGIGIVLSVLSFLALIFLIYTNYNELKKNKVTITSIFLVINALMLFFLFKTYTGKLWDEKLASITFFQFFFRESFILLILMITLFILVVLLIVGYRNEHFTEKYLVIVLVWFILTFYAVNAGPFKYKLSPFRAWMLLAIPVCILSAEGAFNLMSISKKYMGNIGKYSMLVILLTGIYFTSAQQKIAVNTAIWSAGGFWTYFKDESGRIYSPELDGYLWLKDNIPANTNVFTFVNNAPIIAFDKFTCHWCEDINDFQKNGFNKDMQETYNWLKSKDYKYIVIDGQTTRRFGINETNEKLHSLVLSGKFQPIHQTTGFLIFKIL